MEYMLLFSCVFAMVGGISLGLVAQKAGLKPQLADYLLASDIIGILTAILHKPVLLK
jgi:hypothetical protein